MVIPVGLVILTMCRLNLKFKILVEILVGHSWGSIIFDHVQAKFLTLKFLGEILASHTWEVNHF